ncbi:MAG TPA: hypothetical protein VG733_00680 [Chthoniobacteraceae bacterium]|nr:hypothetical protein [Chthoniobacteraceae bacterium]
MLKTCLQIKSGGAAEALKSGAPSVTIKGCGWYFHLGPDLVGAVATVLGARVSIAADIERAEQ